MNARMPQTLQSTSIDRYVYVEEPSSAGIIKSLAQLCRYIQNLKWARYEKSVTQDGVRGHNPELFIQVKQPDRKIQSFSLHMRQSCVHTCVRLARSLHALACGFGMQDAPMRRGHIGAVTSGQRYATSLMDWSEVRLPNPRKTKVPLSKGKTSTKTALIVRQIFSHRLHSTHGILMM